MPLPEGGQAPPTQLYIHLRSPRTAIGTRMPFHEDIFPRSPAHPDFVSAIIQQSPDGIHKSLALKQSGEIALYPHEQINTHAMLPRLLAPALRWHHFSDEAHAFCSQTDLTLYGVKAGEGPGAVTAGRTSWRFCPAGESEELRPPDLGIYLPSNRVTRNKPTMAEDKLVSRHSQLIIHTPISQLKSFRPN